jgi:(heptosyl)LPS beta-1,4-glucosyltransferase
LRPLLSAFVVARDEASRLGACLASLQGVDELVVVDHASTDATSDVALAAGARVERAAASYGMGALRANAHASMRGVWTLFLDADERLPEGGIERLRARLLDTPEAVSALRLPFRNRLGTRWLRFGGYWPARRVRIYRTDGASWSERARVHERLSPAPGRTVDLDALVVEHSTYRDLAHAREKLTRYARAAAQQDFEAGRHPAWGRALARLTWRCFRDLFLRGGLLMGPLGARLAALQAQATLHRERALASAWEKARRDS